MTPSRYTILGGTGFIGSHLARYLRNQGHEVICPGRDVVVSGDEPMGHVIYAIGLTSDFRTRPLETVEAHVCILRQLLVAANFKSLTYLSSTRVYSGVTETHELASVVVNPCVQGDLYNLSKLMGESLCLHGGRSNVKIARLSNIVGVRPDPDIFIDQLLEEGYSRGRIELRTALASKKDYLYIDDAVALIAAIASSAHTGMFNVASGEAIENAEIVSHLRTELGFDVSVAPGAPLWQFEMIDTSKTRSVFGFAPRGFADYFPEFLKLDAQKRNSNEVS